MLDKMPKVEKKQSKRKVKLTINCLVLARFFKNYLTYLFSNNSIPFSLSKKKIQNITRCFGFICHTFRCNDIRKKTVFYCFVVFEDEVKYKKN